MIVVLIEVVLCGISCDTIALSEYYRGMVSIGTIGSLALVIRLYDSVGIESVSMCNIGVGSAVVRILPVLALFILSVHHLLLEVSNPVKAQIHSIL